MTSRETRPNFVPTTRSNEPVRAAFPHTVAELKTISVDREHEDENIVFYTHEVEMDDGIKYIVTSNTVESAKERRKGPENKQFPGADIMALENTAFTTKFGGFYKRPHLERARQFHRPSMLVGVSRNLDRYVNLSRTTNDELAIYAFMAARYGYDPEDATTIGISRGGMGAILKQLYAERYGINVIHNRSIVPSLPSFGDSLTILKNIPELISNEKKTAQTLDLTLEELLTFTDTLDASPRGIVQQGKDILALITSNPGRKVERHADKSIVADLWLQEGDILSSANKWPGIYKEFPNVNVNVFPGGGHFKCVSNQYFEGTMQSEEALASVLHADPSNRKLGHTAMRHLLDAYHDKQTHAA